jgi:hypothetical protein
MIAAWIASVTTVPKAFPASTEAAEVATGVEVVTVAAVEVVTAAGAAMLP